MNDIAGKKILVIENDENAITVFSYFLNKTPHNLSVARDGFEAIRMAENTVFDLFHINITIPKMNGLEVTKTLRKMARYKNAPILIVSAVKPDFGQQESMAAGANRFVSIPVSKDDYINILNDYLKN